MRDDIKLDGDDWEQQLVSALAELPVERAPGRLQRKLKRIPRQQRKHARRAWSWFNPAWAFALLLVPLAVVLHQQNERVALQEQEIAQARQDLVLALKYIEKVNQSAGLQVKAALGQGLARPVAQETSKVIQQPLDITREYDL